MDVWTWLWLAWILMFFAIEMPAVFNKTKGDTFSEHLWKWFAVKDERRTGFVWLRRFVLVVALGWLTVHLISGGWI